MFALDIDNITLDIFKATLARYPDVAPSSLAELDTFRYETVPAKLASLKKEKYLLKADVERLVEWKLKHGTFRPSLLNLVKSNPADLIKSTTKSAFSSLDTDNNPLRALKQLTALRGIGPATASLLMSVYQPDAIPFFSDELFRWTHWGGDAKAGIGWERKIKYNVKEYEGVLDQVGRLSKRLGVGAMDAEKVAFVLGREMADVDGGAGKAKIEEEGGENVEGKTGDAKARAEGIVKAIRGAEAEIKGGGNERGDEVKTLSPPVKSTTEKKGIKRKAQEQKLPTEGTRRSTRRKT